MVGIGPKVDVVGTSAVSNDEDVDKGNFVGLGEGVIDFAVEQSERGRLRLSNLMCLMSTS